jgi:hypothetical protein
LQGYVRFALPRLIWLQVYVITTDRGENRMVSIRSTRWNLILSALFILAMGACGATGGCGACSAVQPLPGGKLPADQTVEGGAQLRVTPHGFSTLTSVLPGLLNQQLAGGFCLPGGDIKVFGLTIASYCQGNQGTCQNGCLVSPTLNNVTAAPNASNAQALTVHVDAKATGTLPISVIGLDCDLSVRIDHLQGNVDVIMATDAASGELKLSATPISSFSITDPVLGNCGFGSDVLSFIVNLFKGTVANTIRDQISPAIQNLLPSFLPSPLGLVGSINAGNLLAGISPGSQAQLEARVVPGGYAHMSGNGRSLGVITGFNADRNPATRGAGLDSEPALCVPALPRPTLGVAPESLPPTARSTFRLDAASAFDGMPDPGATADVALGLSDTMLDLAGHHLVTSGALCLGVGTSFVKQLNVGTISLLVPSLHNVLSGTGTDPLLLVTRPQRALTFQIGDNTEASPALTLGIDHMEVDFYAFLYERYVRVFTLDLTMNIGVNLEFDQPPGQPAKIKPTLVGITPDKVQVKVLNSEFVSETPAQLEAVLPSVFSLVTPLLGNLPEITLPPFAGFELGSLSIHHVTSNQHDFLAIYASLGATSTLRQLASRDALMSSAVAAMDATLPAPQPASTGRARLLGVTTPSPEHIRGVFLHDAGGALPRVAFDVDQVDAGGRALEWAYQLDGGMWRPWRSGPLVIEDAAFAWQGKYTIGLKSRVMGDYHTVSEAAQFPVIIDSVAPQIAADKAAWNTHADTFEVPLFDIVSGRALSYAFGKPGSASPASPWVSGGTAELGRDDAAAYAGDDGQVSVFVKDEAGNTAVAVVAPFHGQPGSAGCASCSARTMPGAGSLAVFAVLGGLVLGRRRRGGRAPARLPWRLRRTRRAVVTGALWTGGAVALSLQPGCSCGSKAPAQQMCEMTTDCTMPCPSNQLPFCVDNTCVCSDDIPPGRIGPYSDVAVGPDGAIWVSAYAQSHGDLVVARATAGRIPDEAWEWVDGVPAGPVVIPGAKIRGGIADDGPDVGMYTSIAVGPDGAPMVSYFDRETASLKLAQKVNGVWQSHVVDPGTGTLGDTGKLVGMYTSLTLRSDDGRPGIAYLAHVKDAQGSRAEVRFASAQSPHPSAAGDWQTWVVDTAPLPPADPANPEIYPLPAGLGLFIDSARMPDQSPVVAYYDRSSGDLKVAKFNVKAGQFSPAKVLDGSNGVDAGWSPSIAVDAKGVVNVAYVGATADDLKFVTDATGAVPQVVDDGYRIVGQTADGLPKPEFHFVGDDASLVLPAGGGAPFVVYQDSTTQELLLGHKQADGSWAHTSIAGATNPWPGGYGFFAAAAVGADQIVMSTWVINLPGSDDANSNWVEVFSRPLTTP